MNKPNKPKLIYDDDIAELFDGQELEVPAALDDHIRSMARAELKHDSAVAGSAKEEFAENEYAKKHVGTSLTSRYAPLFATAAVMLLAVALVPLLIDQSTSTAVEPSAAVPEYSMDSSEVLSSRLAGGVSSRSESASAEERADGVAIERQNQEIMVTDADVAARSLNKERNKLAVASPEATVVVKSDSATERQVIVTAAKEPVQESELALAQEQSALIGGSAGSLEEEAGDITNNSRSLVKQASQNRLMSLQGNMIIG